MVESGCHRHLQLTTERKVKSDTDRQTDRQSEYATGYGHRKDLSKQLHASDGSKTDQGPPDGLDTRIHESMD